MSEVTEIIEEGTAQLEVIEIGGGTIEVVGDDKTTIEIVENISSTNDLNITTQTNIVVVDSTPSEGTTLNISEDSPTTIEIASPDVTIDIIDRVLLSGATELSFNNLVDKPFEFDFATQKTTVNNFSSSTIITNTINSSTGSFSHIEGNSPITFRDEAIFLSDITTSGNISASGTGSFSSSVQLDVGEKTITLGSISNEGVHADISTDAGSLFLQMNGGNLVQFGADALPSSTTNFDLGSSTRLWDNLYVNNISASGLLFTSASNANGNFNQVVLYDTSSGRFYFTGSYGGSGTATIDSVTGSISESLVFNGNRFITRNEAGTFDGSGIPTLNLGTSGSVLNFLDAYFFPNDPPVIDNGNGYIPLINEFEVSGSVVHTLTATDPQVTQGVQTISFLTSSEYTADKFKISPEGVITLNVLATSSLNNISSGYYTEGDGLAHKFSIKVKDSAGEFVEEDLFLRIKPNTSPQFRINNILGEIVTSPQTINLFETSSFTGSIAGTGVSSIPIIHFTDSNSITIRTGSLPDSFTGSFELIINETNVELSQSISSLDASVNSSFTFHLTASDEYFNSSPQLDNNSTSSLSFTINVISNDDPIINNNRLPAINENSPTGTVSANLTSYPNPIPILQDPDNNEVLTITNKTLIGVFLETNGILSSNLTSSYINNLGTSLLDPAKDPFEIINNNVKRKSSVFLNSNLVNLYKYNITAQSSTTGLTGSSGIIEIPINDHLANTVQPGGGNGDEGYVIESSILGNFVSADSNGILVNPRTIEPLNESGNTILQNWVVSSPQGDFFEPFSYGTPGLNFNGSKTSGTGSQIQIRLKSNISESTFTSGSIITCSITASQNDFPTTKQFFEFPVNITENKSPTLTKTNKSNNWFNTLALKDVELVSIDALDPELDSLNDASFTLIGNSSTYLSSSFTNPQTNGTNAYSIRANDTLRNAPTYPTFSFTASLSDVHNFRSSSVSGTILIDPPLTSGSVTFNNADTTNNIFYLIESALEGENVVLQSNGQTSGTPSQIGVNFGGSTGGSNNGVQSISINNDILAITSPGGLLSKGSTAIPSTYNVGDYITASLTITDNFQNEINSTVSVSIAQNFPPTFLSSSVSKLTSSLASNTTIATISNISDPEGDTVTITSRRTDTDETLTVAGSGTTRTISLPTSITASISPINLTIAITASDQFSKKTSSSLIIPIAFNTPPTLNITPTSTPIIAGNSPINTVIATVTTGSTDGDVILVTVTHNQLSIFQTGSFYQVKLDEDILGTNNTNTIISSSITASDGLYTIHEPLNFIVSGNLPPSYTITTSSLVYPLIDGDEIATITNISDDLDNVVTMSIATSNIPGGIELVDLLNTTQSIRVNQFINEFSNTIYTFEVTSSDSFSNESRSLVTLPNVTPALLPTFTSLSGNFRAGNYPQSHSVISLSEITDDNLSFLDTEYTINSSDSNFFLDNKPGEGFKIKAKTEISGNIQTDTTFTGGVTASLKSGINIVNAVSSSYTIIVKGNTSPNVSPIVNSLIVPIISGNIVATITGITDIQTINGQTFGPDTPFSAYILRTDGTLAPSATEYNAITASAGSTSGSSTFLITLPQEVISSSQSNPNFSESFNFIYNEKYITASAFYSPSPSFSYSPNKAFDSSFETYWLALNCAKDEFKDSNIFVDFDFGSYMSRNPIITQIDVNHNGGYGHYRYQISGSNDSTTWVGIHQEEENISSLTRTLTFNNETPYKFYRILADNENHHDDNHGPGLSHTLFYESPAENNLPYTIESQSIGDTTNWNIKYIGTSPIIYPQTINLNVEIYDSFLNTGSSDVSLVYLNNTPPSYTANIPLNNIISPISASQVIATIAGITDAPDNDVPYTCSVFNSDGVTLNSNFVASTGSNTDTTNFSISCSLPFVAPTTIPLNLIVKVEDNFGSFSSSLLTFNIIGDNVAPTINTPSPLFEVDEHRQNNHVIGILTSTLGNIGDIVTFGTSNNYTDNYFNVAADGSVTANVHLSASYNTIDDGGELKHKLIVTASDQHGGSSPDTDIFIRITPNVAPTFIPNTETINFGSFNEFISTNSSIGQVSATDTQGINNTPITYRTASSYLNATPDKIAVNCNSSTGELTFRIPTTESMHNFNSNKSHSVVIEALDNHGNVASQSVNFNIIPNEAPKFRINSTAGTIISSPYTASINEDETAFTQSFFYSDSNAEDTITINSTSPEPFNSYWDIYNISAENKIEIRQKAGQDLEFDTHGNSFHFTLSASDNHFTSNPQQDLNSQTTIAINLALSDGVTPTFNNTINGVTESAAPATTAGTIDSSNFSSTFTIEAFTINSKRLDGGSFVICTPGLLGNSATNTPADDPFELDGNDIKLKNGVYLNSDIFNSYRYSASIKNPGGNVNSIFINIPIKDQHSGTFNDSDTFNIIESAIQGNYIVSDVEGFGSNQSSITFTSPSEFNTSDYSFEVSSSNQFFNASPSTGNTLNFQLNKNLSGSSAVFLAGNSLPIEFTASLIEFPTSKLFGTITPTITTNSAPPLNATENQSNWNDVDANMNNALVTLTVGNDPEGDNIDVNSLTLSPTTHLTASFASFGSNQINIRAKDNTTLSVASSPYDYTASISDIHGFTSSSVLGSIVIGFGDVGELNFPASMHTINSATSPDFVVTDQLGIGDINSSLVGVQAQLSVTYNNNSTTNTFTTLSKPNEYFSINSGNGLISVNNISTLVSNGDINVTEEIHFMSSTSTPGTGSININIEPNSSPIVSFTQVSNLQFPILEGQVLGTIIVTDPEDLDINPPTISSIIESPAISGNTISLTGTNGTYSVIATSLLLNITAATDINFNIIATDTFNNTTVESEVINITAIPANTGELVLSDGDTDLNFFILETANALDVSTLDVSPLTLNSSNLSATPSQYTGWQPLSTLVDGTTAGGASSNASLWFHNNSTIDLIHDFTTPTIIGRYAFYPNNNMDPKGGSFKGSYDGTTYFTLDNFPFSTAGEEVDRDDNTWSGGVNNTAYRFYKFTFGPDYQGNNYMALYEIQFYGKSTSVGGGDPLVTSALGIPNTIDRVILSASFGTTSEINPVPNFSIDNNFFHISTSIEGLGYLQVSPTFNATYNDSAPTSITPNITYTTQNGTTKSTPITINITENFGPTATTFTQTTGTYMTASNASSLNVQSAGTFLTITDKVFTVGGIIDVEGDDPSTVTITSGDVTAEAITFDGGNTGSFEVFPTTTITNNDIGTTYNFNFRLTDSKGKFRNFTNNQFTIATPVLEEPFDATKIYIYTSEYQVPVLDNDLFYNGYLLGWGQSIQAPPALSGVTDDDSTTLFSNFRAGGQLGNNFTMGDGSQVKMVKEINVTSATDLNTKLEQAGVYSTDGGNLQTLIIFPNTSDITGKPTEMSATGHKLHVEGGGVVGTTSFGAATAGVDDFAFGLTAESANVNIITLDTAHEGYTEWYVIGQQGGSVSTSFEVRVKEQ